MSPESFDDAEDPLLAGFAGLDLRGVVRSWQSPNPSTASMSADTVVAPKEIKKSGGKPSQDLSARHSFLDARSRSRIYIKTKYTLCYLLSSIGHRF